MAVRGVQYWSSSERITKLNELLNKIKKNNKNKKKALKWPNKTRQRQDVGLVTVDTKLTVYIQYDVPFKGQVLPILCTFSNSNFLHWYFLLAWESSMMDTGCLYNTSFTKREKKKKAEKQMFKFHWNNNEQTTTMCALKSLAYLHWMPCSLTWKSNLSLDTQTCLWFNLWPMRGI